MLMNVGPYSKTLTVKKGDVAMLTIIGAVLTAAGAIITAVLSGGQ
jgi:hypothetical protein